MHLHSFGKASSKESQTIRMSCISSVSRLVPGIEVSAKKRKRLGLKMVKELDCTPLIGQFRLGQSDRVLFLNFS